MTINSHSRAISAYREAFGQEPDLVVRAPGRVNLIGEHTDYNDGFVLPLAIDRDTVVAAGKTSNLAIELVAADLDGARDTVSLGPPIAPGRDDWANYVRGVARALADEGAVWPGVRMAIAGDVPLGSGLSSSAALEMASGLALAELAGLPIDRTRLAQLGQWAEHNFAGCLCGIMDQLISARGQSGHAMLIDCRSLVCTPVALPADIRVIIAHSGIRHSNVGGEYNERRAQCEAAARHYGVPALRDLDVATFERERGDLADLPYRRARHVVTENARTTAAAAALSTGDLVAMGELMAQSHASMRDDFAITLPEIDALVAIMAAPLGGHGGARMTGGGFGGCALAVTSAQHADAVVAAVAEHYRDPDGHPAQVFVCEASDGASIIAPVQG